MVRRISFPALALAVLVACHGLVPPNGPDRACRTSCNARTETICSAGECVRGCEMILDRTLEHEGETVIACVARSRRGCADTIWAECAARVGPRADGGPPAPVTETFPDED